MTIALFCGLGVLLGVGIFMAPRVLRSLELGAAGGKITARTSVSDFRVEKASESGPGLPVYPRASLVLPWENARAATLKNNPADVQTVTYHTNDIREIVDSWYLAHLSPEFVRHDAGDEVFPDVFREARISDQDITFVGERGDQVRIAAIVADSTGTQITLVRFTKRGPQ